MTVPVLRHACRALILDEQDDLLLCRFDFRHRGGPVVWAAPGGGIDPGEAETECLRRELAEEVGIELTVVPPKVWRHEVVSPGLADGYDGLVDHYFMLRTGRFAPRGAFSDEQLAAENVTGFTWWSLEEIRTYDGPDTFAPRRLATHLADLLRDGPPAAPLELRG
jgi:8-oxo-dGTP diphosphatase